MKDKNIIKVAAKTFTDKELQTNPKKKIINLIKKFPGVIDTNQYKKLYPYSERKRNGRFRNLPNIEFKQEVKDRLKELEG